MEKTIGLVIATTREFEAIFGSSNISYRTIETCPFRIEELIINNKRVVAINAGVGEVYAAMATQYLIDHYNVELIINYGVVGSLSDDLDLKSTVIIDKIFDYEFDTSAIDNCPIGFRSEFNDIFISGINDTLRSIIKNEFNIPLVNCASGNKFIADVNFKNELYKKYNCSICEMEALGIALTAIKNKKPTLFVKGVSDTKHGGADEFNKMIIESSKVTFDLVIALLERI